MGLEPTTPGLGSLAEGLDTRRRSTPNLVNRAGFRRLRPSGPAWLRRPVLERLGHEWRTRGREGERNRARETYLPLRLVGLLGSRGLASRSPRLLVGTLQA